MKNLVFTNWSYMCPWKSEVLIKENTNFWHMEYESSALLYYTKLELSETTLVIGGTSIWYNYTFEIYIEFVIVQVVQIPLSKVSKPLGWCSQPCTSLQIKLCKKCVVPKSLGYCFQAWTNTQIKLYQGSEFSKPFG